MGRTISVVQTNFGRSWVWRWPSSNKVIYFLEVPPFLGAQARGGNKQSFESWIFKTNLQRLSSNRFRACRARKLSLLLRFVCTVHTIKKTQRQQTTILVVLPVSWYFWHSEITSGLSFWGSKEIGANFGKNQTKKQKWQETNLREREVTPARALFYIFFTCEFH